MNESTGNAPMIDEAALGSDDPIITITPDELRTAIAVWLRVAPRHIWAPYEKMLTIDRKRRREGDDVDPRDILADYIAGKFLQAKWMATRERPEIMTDRTGPGSRDSEG